MPALWQEILGRAMPIALRVGGLMTFAPFLGSQSVPVRVKAALTFALTGLLFYAVPAPPAPLQPAGWAQLAAGETVLGLMLGLCVQFVLEAAQLAGQIVGIQIGFGLVNILDPQTEVDTPVLSIFHQMIALLLLLQFNVHHWILRGIVRSFSFLPAGSFRLSPAVAREFLHVAQTMFAAGVQIAAPVLLATLMVDITVGFVSKASPQLPALFFSIPLKLLAGLLLLAVTVGYWPALYEKQFMRAMQWSDHLLHLAR